MNAAQLLQELKARRITVALKDGRLQVTAPKDALTDELKASLSLHKDALLAALGAAGGAAPELKPAGAIDGLARVSFSQERLWFLSQFDHVSRAYAMPTTVRVTGALSVPAFRACVGTIVGRHAALRTVFEETGGEAFQRVLPVEAVDVPCPVVDLSSVDQATRGREALARVEEETGRPFDLSRGPLLRVVILDMGESAEGREHIVVFTMHHIISDGWSSDVLLQEFATLYQARLEGRVAELPPLSIQYVDYAVWQRDWLSGGALDRQLDYWRGALSGANFTLDLPTDRPRPLVQDNLGRTLRFDVPAEVTRRLRELSRQQGATLYMTLLATFFLLLSRWSGENDICVGSPVANRRRVELEGLIGFFVNTLVMRGDLKGDPDFLSFLSRVRDFCLGAQEHQDLPFERLVEALSPARDLSRTPLFQTMFSMQNAPARAFSLPGVTIAPYAAETGVAKFDLSLELMEDADGALTGELEYATSLFDEATARRMAGHYLTLLDSVVATPQARVSRLRMLTPAEQEALTQGFNGTLSDFDIGCLHDGFASSVARTPEAVALVLNDERLTYAELNRRANRLAHRLIAQGIGPDVIVALCFERSLEMIVCLLATLKAGGAYLPLDPDLPGDRLVVMIRDAAPKVILAGEDIAPRLASLLVENHLDASASAVAPYSRARHENALLGELDADPTTLVRPDNLAYLIYTSGSTGLPKAVGLTHANVARLFAATQELFNFTRDDVWTLFHSYAFDFSVWEIWGALLYGGRLVIVPYLVSRSPEDFYRVLCDNAVTVLNQTPSAFYNLEAVDASAEGPLALRLVIFGGEALDEKRLTGWFERHPEDQPRLVNMYGITETTVHVTAKDVKAAPEGAGTIGRPLADLRCFILDPSLQPAPIGVCGELYVAGPGLARGYLGRPQLTAERFIADPFSGNGGRLYKTGDLCRRLASGEIEYLGRADRQVKISGFRIELGEIESALAQLPGVRAAVTIVSNERLVAYVATHDVAAFDAAGAIAALRRSLPAYMIPQLVIPLERLPLNRNGKVDKAALPQGDLRNCEKSFLAPKTPLEWLISQAFRETLGVDRVSMDDNFFELGGSSILGLKLVERIRRSLGENMFVAAIFQAPTPQELAQLLFETQSAMASPLVRLTPGRPCERKLFCLHPAGGSVTRYRALADSLTGCFSVYGVQSRALLDPAHRTGSIEDMARDYAALLRAEQPVGPYRLLGWSTGGAIALGVAQALEAQGDVVDFIALLDPTLAPPVDNPATDVRDHLTGLAEFFGIRLDLSEEERRALVAIGAPLDDRDRFVAAGRWGRERGLWSDVSDEVLRFLYDDSVAHSRMLASFTVPSVEADVHVWWAEGADFALAQTWSRGHVHAQRINRSHERIVSDATVHAEIAEMLKGLGPAQSRRAARRLEEAQADE